MNGTLVEGFLYRSQLKPAVWLKGDGSVRATFVYGRKPNVPEYMVLSGTTYRIITDQVGSVRLVENTSSGAVAERIDYDEFGNVLADTAPGTQPFGFAGGLRDLDTGLARFGARDYDPVTGRWTAKDPLRFGGGDTDIYAYCASDAINCIDPSGRYGFGFNLGAGAEGGLPGILGSGVNVSSGPGVFFDQNMPLLSGNPFSAGWLTSFGAFGEAPGADGLFTPAGQPQACMQVRPAVVGAFAGLGVGPYITSATSAEAMKGPFNVISLNIGFGPGVSITFAYDSQTWVVGLSGRLPSGGWSMSSYPTYTVGPTFGHR